MELRQAQLMLAWSNQERHLQPLRAQAIGSKGDPNSASQREPKRSGIPPCRVAHVQAYASGMKPPEILWKPFIPGYEVEEERLDLGSSTLGEGGRWDVLRGPGRSCAGLGVDSLNG